MSEKKFDWKGFTSAAVHGGHIKDPMYAHQVPIYASSTYVYDMLNRACDVSAEKKKDIFIRRWGNPTMQRSRRKIAALETFGLGHVKQKVFFMLQAWLLFLHSCFPHLKPGDKILTHFSLYGGTE